jgi:tRNA(fMet)-specific endonuclease VapC
LPWTSEAAKSYARIPSDLEHSGEPMRNLDMMIAAHALAAEAALVTHDRVFRGIEA